MYGHPGRYTLHLPQGDTTGMVQGWIHDDVIKWKHFQRYWPFVREIHRSPVNSPHKGQWRGALMFSWIRAWINGWVNNGEAGDLRRHHAHYDVIVMNSSSFSNDTDGKPRLPLVLVHVFKAMTLELAQLLKEGSAVFCQPFTNRSSYISGLVQERCNSSVLAMELCLCCTNPSIYAFKILSTLQEW